MLKLVNESKMKMSTLEAINQLGHFLSMRIHAFAEVEDDVKVFMAKWDTVCLGSTKGLTLLQPFYPINVPKRVI